jgi:hypothetical protein
MKFKETVVAYAIVWILCLFGWGNNLYRLTQCDFDTPLKAEVIRGAGVIVFPLGIVLGYITIEDEKD